MFSAKRCCVGVFLMGAAGVVQAGVAMTDQPFVGQTWLVACRNLPLHQAASGFSPTRGGLAYRDQVRITQLVGKYDLPESQQDKNASSDSDSLMGGGGKEYFAWAEVEAGGRSGFVPLSCLVNGALIDGPHEDPIKFSEKRVAPISAAGEPESATSSRGFSRKTTGDKVAMRGMTGGMQDCTDANAQVEGAVSARGFSKKTTGDKVAMRGMSAAAANVCIKEDHAGLLRQIETAPFVADPYSADKAFRQQGALGEFK
jgi:hypothetical protein